MKINNLPLLMLVLLMTSQLLFGQTKHALIVAIGNYPESSRWRQISSDNDTVLIKKALSTQNFKDIKVIHDKETTVKGISQAIEQLIEKSLPGDIDVIHFSSHGEQIEDSLRHKADGLEECIVTYDAKWPDPAKKPYTKAYIKSLFPGYYREDMLGAYVNKLREKLGKTGDLVLFLDLCHAGSGTRGIAKIRGGQDALVTPGFNLNLAAPTDIANALSNNTDKKKDESNLAAYVVIGAAMANENDYETIDLDSGTGYGSLSYAISKAFSEVTREKQSHLTYRMLFARIQSIISENPTVQHPVLAGNGKDKLVFKDSIINQKPYVEIEKITGNHLTISGGKVMGLDSGAKVALYPANTINPQGVKFLDTGTIIKTGLFTSEVLLKKSASLKHASDGWVFITAPVFKNPVLKISIPSSVSRGAGTSMTFSQPEKFKIQKELKTVRGISFTGTPELKIVRGVKMDSIIIAQTGLLFDTISSASADTARLKNKITQYMRYTFLKSIYIPDPILPVHIKFIPLKDGKIDSARLKAGDTLSFKDGDKFRLLITNKAKYDVYVNILDMQPDGIINPLLPNTANAIEATELLFPAGSTTLFPKEVTIAPPYGKETFKIFVSKKLIDMQAIANTHGFGQRGSLGVLESLVNKSYNLGTRGATTSTVKLSDASGSTFNLTFDILPK